MSDARHNSRRPLVCASTRDNHGRVAQRATGFRLLELIKFQAGRLLIERPARVCSSPPAAKIDGGRRASGRSERAGEQEGRSARLKRGHSRAPQSRHVGRLARSPVTRARHWSRSANLICVSRTRAAGGTNSRAPLADCRPVSPGRNEASKRASGWEARPELALAGKFPEGRHCCVNQTCQHLARPTCLTRPPRPAGFERARPPAECQNYHPPPSGANQTGRLAPRLIRGRPASFCAACWRLAPSGWPNSRSGRRKCTRQPLESARLIASGERCQPAPLSGLGSFEAAGEPIVCRRHFVDFGQRCKEAAAQLSARPLPRPRAGRATPPGAFHSARRAA